MSEHRHCAYGRVVAHNLQLQAENESLTRRLAAQIESAERMARERAADVGAADAAGYDRAVADVMAALGCLSDLGSKQQRAVNAKLREDNKKLRAYVAAWGGVAYWRELARRNEIAG